MKKPKNLQRSIRNSAYATILILIFYLHSRLLKQLRLPFGRKKKQQQHEPLPPALLAPAPEEARTPTPVVDDDIESVKQLTAMGFSRSEAVSALEKTGYDVQTALNNLLGS